MRSRPDARFFCFALAVALLASALSACNKEEAAPVVAEETLTAQDSDLLARRDALMSMRKRISSERDEIAEQRKVVRSRGGDESALEARAAKLADEESELRRRESDFHSTLETLLSQRRAMLQSIEVSSKEGAVRARESALAHREDSVGKREGALAAREAQLAERERILAVRERETCGAATTTVIAPPAGSTYSRKDVEPLLKKARRAMASKGLLKEDLPVPARALEREATRAMAKGDFGQAMFAASQLTRTAESLQVNKAFIAAKIDRLGRVMRGRKLDASRKSRVDQSFLKATASYGDGKFSDANRHLNAIVDLLAKG